MMGKFHTICEYDDYTYGYIHSFHLGYTFSTARFVYTSFLGLFFCTYTSVGFTHLSHISIPPWILWLTSLFWVGLPLICLFFFICFESTETPALLFWSIMCVNMKGSISRSASSVCFRSVLLNFLSDIEKRNQVRHREQWFQTINFER